MYLYSSFLILKELKCSFQGAELFRMVTAWFHPHVGYQGKYVDVDKLKSKTLQSQVPRGLHVKKKGHLEKADSGCKPS